MSIIIIIFMILAGVGAVVGMRAAKAGSAMGAPVAIGCSLLTIILAIANMSPGRGSAKKYVKMAERFERICGEQLGTHLTEKYPNQRVLVMVRPHNEDMPLSSSEEALLEGLQSTLGDTMQKVDVIAIEMPKDQQDYLQKMINENQEAIAEGEADYLVFEMMDYQMWFNDEQFEQLVRAKKSDYDIIIVTLDLPFEVNRLRVFRDDKAPKLALVNSGPATLKKALRSGIVAAAITYRPDPAAWEDYTKPPKDDQEAFDKRYLLLTPDNIEAVAAEYPDEFSN